jgi:hypothetical protein
MQTDIKSKCLEFLYAQVSKGNMPQIRKGMVEDLELFVENIRANDQSKRIVDRMQLEAQAKALGAQELKEARETKEASNE